MLCNNNVYFGLYQLLLLQDHILAAPSEILSNDDKQMLLTVIPFNFRHLKNMNSV